jgi:ferritin-like metal-binding protein YciE
MSNLPNLHALLVDELRDLYYAEKQLVKAIPKLAKASSDPDLKSAFLGHLRQTRGHVARLARAMKILGTPVKGTTCHAILGLIKEGGKAIETEGPAPVRDANLIGAAQRVEHYEIAGYGTARAFAQSLGEHRVADLLTETLDEEGAADHKLTEISALVNQAALRLVDSAGFVTAA